MGISHVKADEFSSTIEKIAKDIRREYYIKRHVNVESIITFWTSNKFSEYIKSNEFEEPLELEEINEIDDCFKTRICQVYLISITSDYMGGSGVDHNWVLFNTKTKNYKTIFQTVYSE